jgi:hypothetical protein
VIKVLVKIFLVVAWMGRTASFRICSAGTVNFPLPRPMATAGKILSEFPFPQVLFCGLSMRLAPSFDLA